MRILLAAKYVPCCSRPIGGVQSWNETVAAELRRCGHEVVLWCPEWPRPEDRFDVGIFANVRLTGCARLLCWRSVVVSHGIIPDEQPDGAAVFTSEGVRDHWAGTGPVIRQPIDCEFWKPDGGRRDGGILRYSYRAGLEWLGAVADKMGLRYQHLRNVSHEQAREAMRRAQCVLATGRAALEAAACGAPVVICDHRSSYQGPLAAPFGMSQARQNYSGRGGFAPTPESMRRMIEDAMPAEGWRQYVQTHHNARDVVRRLLAAE